MVLSISCVCVCVYLHTLSLSLWGFGIVNLVSVCIECFLVYTFPSLSLSLMSVVVPPQIEAQPCDVVGVVTGKQVLFSVAISCQRPRGGAEQGAGPETRERVGSRGQEDLQISWQFQRAHPAAAVAIGNHAEGGAYIYTFCLIAQLHSFQIVLALVVSSFIDWLGYSIPTVYHKEQN